ncbi:MAG: hypothetical protein JNL98_01475 [Bryobacterales bacterium]|nr:hypothetical protein [Bryobacterales bacterium]
MVDLIASVGIAGGRHCRNRLDDQSVVMDMLNMVPAAEGGTMQPGGIRRRWPPAIAGVASPDLHAAIRNFQSVNRHRGLLVDGHLDPGQRGIRVLNELAAKERAAPDRGTSFSLSVLPDAGSPTSAVVLISLLNEAAVGYAYYTLTPRGFGEAVRRKLFGDGAMRTQGLAFETPEAMTTASFDGPARLFELFNSGAAAVCRYFFTANKADGSRVVAAVNMPVNPANNFDIGAITGTMQLRERSDRPSAARK